MYFWRGRKITLRAGASNHRVRMVWLGCWGLDVSGLVQGRLGPDRGMDLTRGVRYRFYGLVGRGRGGDGFWLSRFLWRKFLKARAMVMSMMSGMHMISLTSYVLDYSIWYCLRTTREGRSWRWRNSEQNVIENATADADADADDDGAPPECVSWM